MIKINIIKKYCISFEVGPMQFWILIKNIRFFAHIKIEVSFINIHSPAIISITDKNKNLVESIINSFMQKCSDIDIQS